ncbi:MAG: class I SAM-dependent methyltransferase, partial [Bdellovibrio sp.]
MPKQKFDKYSLYIQAVQSPETDIDFLIKTFYQLKSRRARSLREDFCGTFALAHEWVQRSKEHWALALDLDPEALNWGKRNFYEPMEASQKKRLHVFQQDVRSALSK